MLPKVSLYRTIFSSRNLIRALNLFDQVAQPLGRVHGTAGFVVRRREAIDANLHYPLLNLAPA
jgi:hypothetical protein